MKLLIELIGYGLILLALIHAMFPKAFDWKNQLASLTLINRQLMSVHTFFVALTVFLMGILCITSAKELLSTSLGKKNSHRTRHLLGDTFVHSALQVFPAAMERETTRNFYPYSILNHLVIHHHYF
jgi:hypothetical protein